MKDVLFPEEILRREERYRAFIEHSSEGIWCFEIGHPVSVDLPEDKQIEEFYASSVLAECNAAMARMYGCPNVSDLVGTRLDQLLVPSEPENIEYLRAFIRSGYRLLDAESHEFDRQGQSKFFLNNLVGTVVDGRLIRVWGTQRDITEMKRLEEQLVQAQKMEAVGRLAGGVAHDFNNLLTAILGYTEMLLERAQRGSDDELQEIRKASLRASDLTRQLLAFSRRQVLQTKIVDLNSIISDIEKMLRHLIGAQIDVAISPSPEAALVKVDPGQMQQVVMNLALNSRDAMPEGGRLTIETSRVELQQKHASRHGLIQPGRYVVLAVSDSGSGMDEETRSRIFDPFFTTKGPAAGTGLGLATVYGIVKQSGGHICVDSEPGRGSTFRVYLTPAVEEPDARQEESPPAAALGGNETILLVEDEDAIRQLAATILARHGYVALSAEDGRKALELSRAHEGPIHLMVTDVVMPHMSGRELADRMRGERPELRILFTSGYSSEVFAHRETVTPNSEFLHKPFTVNGLVEKVRSVLDR